MIVPHLIQKIRPTKNKEYDTIVFPSGVEEIHLYGCNLIDSKNERKRRYLIELHISTGFAMVKFYPKHLKNHKRKYEIRGEDKIGYALSKPNVINLIYACAIVMRDYLDLNPDCFVGYVGQTDNKDNVTNRRRIISQRCSIYNPLVDTIFTYPKYKLSSRKVFEEVNLRLIRKNRSKQEGKITKEQMKNYHFFLTHFKLHKSYHFEMMTDETKLKYSNN